MEKSYIHQSNLEIALSIATAQQIHYQEIEVRHLGNKNGKPLGKENKRQKSKINLQMKTKKTILKISGYSPADAEQAKGRIIHRQSLPFDGKAFLDAGFNNVEVEVLKYPISDRYCHKGAVGTVRNKQIRVGGAWFDLDERWIVKQVVKPASPLLFQGKKARKSENKKQKRKK